MFSAGRLALGLTSTLLISPLLIPSNYQQRKFHQFVKQRKYNWVRFLLYSPKIDPTFDNNEAILHACRFGDFAMVKILYADSRINCSDKCIGCAILWNYMDLFKFLLKDKRLDPNNCINNIVYEQRKEMLDIIKKDPRVSPHTLNKARISYPERSWMFEGDE
jgi:hypothetical protein